MTNAIHRTPGTFVNSGHFFRGFLEYRENPWPGDHIDDGMPQGISGAVRMVGGQAMRWNAVTPRYPAEDSGPSPQAKTRPDRSIVLELQPRRKR